MARGSGGSARCRDYAGLAAKLMTVVPILLALGMLCLQLSQQGGSGRRRRVLLELPDELPGDGWSHSTDQLPLQDMGSFEAQQGQHGPLPRPSVHPAWLRSAGASIGEDATGGAATLDGGLLAVGGGGGGWAVVGAPQFVRYTSSRWEQEWVAGAPSIQEDPSLVCGVMLQQVGLSKAWVHATGQGARLLRTAVSDGALKLDPEVFSRFTYRDPGTGDEYGVWIEPLVGHFRHPYNPAACVPPGMPPLPIQDRSYLLLHGLSQQQFQRLYPGRKYLIDMGTATFESSLGWFVEHYGDWGITFDEMWAWEVTNMQPTEYWSHVPAATRPHLHFYNIPVTIDAMHPDNPINILKSIYRPGDFVVIKLDIDNTPLESQLIEQVRRDPAAISMIAEMHFEMHYDHPDMHLAFGHPNATWIEVLQTFSELRSQGLRLHYWP